MSQKREDPSPAGINEETEICLSIILAAVKELGRKVDARFDRLESRLTPIEDLNEGEQIENEQSN